MSDSYEATPDDTETKRHLPDCNKPGCTRERYTSNGHYCRKHRVSRPPCDAVAHMTDTANYDGLERRVCPNCRLYFDTGEGADDVFCGPACRRRHERGEYL